MLEIEETMPYYICEFENFGDDGPSCFVNGVCQKECHHTISPFHAKHKEAIDIFNKFCDTFHVCVDDYGRLVCTEKEASHDG